MFRIDFNIHRSSIPRNVFLIGNVKLEVSPATATSGATRAIGGVHAIDISRGMRCEVQDGAVFRELKVKAAMDSGAIRVDVYDAAGGWIKGKSGTPPQDVVDISSPPATQAYISAPTNQAFVFWIEAT